ncbi:MAG: RpoL/Rpb11 RNA polymerase subunit family protein [Thermoproteota archaeon]|nr:RpoL/Rpb11 RNA polymerase subunit family protein [Thermoproteota archaeon]
MDVQLENLAKNKVKLSISDGDIGVLYVIQYELIKNSNPEFAGVITRHPLTNELWMQVNSKNPLNEISKATSSAIAVAAELKKTLTSKIK